MHFLKILNITTSKVTQSYFMINNSLLVFWIYVRAIYDIPGIESISE